MTFFTPACVYAGCFSSLEELGNCITAPFEHVRDLTDESPAVEAGMDRLGIESVKELDSSMTKNIKLASGEAQVVLTELQKNLQQLLKDVGNLYDGKLNLTFDKLDILSTKKIKEIELLSGNVNSLIQSDIMLTSVETRKAIQQLSNSLQDAISRIEGVVIVAGEASVYVIDRTVNNAISLVALIMIGVGLLLVFKMFFRYGMPRRNVKYIVFSSVGLFFALFFLMLVSSNARAYVMNYSGVGLHKRIAIDPPISSSGFSSSTELLKNRKIDDFVYIVIHNLED